MGQCLDSWVQAPAVETFGIKVHREDQVGITKPLKRIDEFVEMLGVMEFWK